MRGEGLLRNVFEGIKAGGEKIKRKKAFFDAR